MTDREEAQLDVLRSTLFLTTVCLMKLRDADLLGDEKKAFAQHLRRAAEGLDRLEILADADAPPDELAELLHFVSSLLE